MRRGQKNYRNKKSILEKIFKKTAPHSFLENKLIHLDKLNQDSRDLWKDFQDILAKEREKVLDKIKEALYETSSVDFSLENAGRIVGSQFSTTPLSCKGSYLRPLGGRFNFGQSVSYQNYFPALYVSDSYETAYSERFPKQEKRDINENFTELSLALQNTDSFSYYRINLFLERVIDIRKKKPLTAFYNSIKHIKMPKDFQKRAKKLKVKMSIIKDVQLLKDRILEPNYEQWDFWIDCYSTSQWFGHYARLSGIQGVIYPSVRSDSGFNVAIFPDQFKDTSSYIKSPDETDSIKDSQKRMDAENFETFL